MNRIVHGDCLEVMREMEEASIDAIVTDPPFFCPATHYQSRVKWQRRWSDMSILTHWWGLISDSLVRVLKPTGHCIVFCNSDSYPAFYPAMYERWAKLVSVVWDKERPGLGRVWRHQHELIIAARGEKYWTPDDGRLRADVIRCKATLTRNRQHPVEKPAPMLRELIEAICPRDGIVFDPFCGSGTTGAAAIQSGRGFIGIEKQEEYVTIARARVEHWTPEPTLPLRAESPA